MNIVPKKLLRGYQLFKQKYVDNNTLMKDLAATGQHPNIMVVACSDSRVDPAVLFQIDPGDMFVVRNVANIVPSYEKDGKSHGTSAALEFGVRFLHVEHVILLGHSQCGGIQALKDWSEKENDFIMPWVSFLSIEQNKKKSTDVLAQEALHQSYAHCLTFPWIFERFTQKKLAIHRMFFDIQTATIWVYDTVKNEYQTL